MKEAWDKLYNWLNDMRLGIAPDETVTDEDERHDRLIQVDILDEILDWMCVQEPKTDTWSIKDVADTLAKHGLIAEQEPCEDAVSRQAVCNIVDAIRDCISVEGYWAILERLKKLPSVNPQKIGHWIEPKDFMWENPKCSECGFESADHDNYCPHCGIRMVEPQESEDKDEDNNV